MEPKTFLDQIESASFRPWMGVPCSVFTPLINYLNDSGKECYACTSEGEAMGLAGGFALSGKLPVVYMQNDGYGNAVNPLSSLQMMYKLPALLLISWRGFPGKKDAPQHMLMGKTIEGFLRLFDIPYTVLDEEAGNLGEAVGNARNHCMEKGTPYAFIIRKGYFSKYGEKPVEEESGLGIRIDYLDVLKSRLKGSDLLLGTTGFTGRELYSYLDHPGKFYMTGSMGCLSAVGLGVALENRDRRVFLLDGDGSLLMKMGGLATVGTYSPGNLTHICFDNRAYESTGNQPTLSRGVKFGEVARSCGYKTVFNIDTPEQFGEILDRPDESGKPAFIRIRIRSGTLEELPRPSDTPEEMKDKFSGFMKSE